ncbi:kynureninase, partial [Christiangramia marina]
MKFENSLEFAQRLDKEDVLANYRNEFIFPKIKGKDAIYFVGNSLGLQPRTARKYVDDIMQDWAELGVE